MNRLRLNRNFILLLVIASGIFYGGYGLSRQWLGLPVPSLASAGSPVGERGPVGLVFAQAMQTQSVEQRFKISPDVKGRFEWGGNTTLWFFPDAALAPGKTYQIMLAVGSLGLDGGTIRQDTSWQMSIRTPRILYQSPTGETADLWLRSLALEEPQQLTSGKNTFDFAVSYDGNQIAYSAANDQKGYDLWIMGSGGKNARIVVDCGVGRCVNPAWSPDGENIAYSRFDAVESQGSVPTKNAYSQNGGGFLPVQLSASRIWTVNINSGRTLPLYSDLRITGSDTAWSPDGKWLAFVDSGAGGIRVVNLDSRADQLFPANTPVLGGWSPDGSKLFFGDLDVNDLPSFGAAFQIDVPSLKESGLFERGPDQTDYGVPAMSPNGEWVAEGVRIVQGFSSRQLWLLSPDGSKQQIISSDQVITHGAYSWSPDGNMILFQQVALDSSTAKPDVMFWNSSSNALTLIAKDATHPQWLP
jgi:Tol biopolymer transport system component